MSTYAVFGMTRARAVDMARKKTPTTEKRDGKYVGLSALELEVKVQEAADSIMRGTKTVQLSEKYDAPTFAFEYIELARKTTVSRGLHVKSYAKTGEMRKGKPVMQWGDVAK